MSYDENIKNKTILYLLKDTLSLSIDELCKYLEDNCPSVKIEFKKKLYAYLGNIDRDVCINKITDYIIDKIDDNRCKDTDIELIKNNIDDIFFDISEHNGSILVECI